MDIGKIYLILGAALIVGVYAAAHVITPPGGHQDGLRIQELTRNPLQLTQNAGKTKRHRKYRGKSSKHRK
jgi:hypothetical protein